MAAWFDTAGSSPNCFITALHLSQMRFGFRSAGSKEAVALSDAMSHAVFNQ
jgi:hypothetical protein